MKNLFLLMVATLVWGASQAQNCWTLPTYTEYAQVNTNTVYQSYQQNSYQYQNPYVNQNPYQYQQPNYYQPQQNIYYQNNVNNASHNLGHAIGDLVNIVIRETRRTNRSRRCTAHRVRNCNCCR